MSSDLLFKLKLSPNEVCEDKLLQKSFFLRPDTDIPRVYEISITKSGPNWDIKLDTRKRRSCQTIGL